MSIISLAIANVHQEIYHDALVEAFLTPDEKNYYKPVNIDGRIMEEVINKRVMPDLNIEYSRRLTLSLRDCQINMENIQTYVITVPPEILNNRKIITVLGLNFLDYQNSYYAAQYPPFNGVNGGAILTAGQKLANSTQSIPPNYNTNIQLISGNAFVVRRLSYIPPTCSVDLIIENDPELNNIPITMADTIKELVLLATKWHIHRELKARVNRAKLESGSEMTFFSEIVDEYRDANEQYKELLKDISAKALMADEESKTEFMTMLISPLV